jgi:hypothetical protein
MSVNKFIALIAVLTEIFSLKFKYPLAKIMCIGADLIEANSQF